jgi:hypothetical protein
MTPERAAERAAYLAAFTAANGKEPYFTLDWENGWWCVRYAAERRPVRYRRRVLQQMTLRLRAKARGLCE